MSGKQVVLMKIRKLSVYRDFKNKPYILLKGKWLKQLDFNFHDKIEIITSKNKIVIKKIKGPKQKL